MSAGESEDEDEDDVDRRCDLRSSGRPMLEDEPSVSSCRTRSSNFSIVSRMSWVRVFDLPSSYSQQSDLPAFRHC